MAKNYSSDDLIRSLLNLKVTVEHEQFSALDKGEDDYFSHKGNLRNYVMGGSKMIFGRA